MLPDLTFVNGALEGAFLASQRASSRRAVARFALFRAILLLATTVRALLAARTLFAAELLFLLGAASNLAPLAVALSPALESKAHRSGVLACACVLTEVLQAAIGGFLHRHMAISHAGIRPGASLVYLSYGSTVLWLHCYALFSWLPFRLLLVQQGAAAAVLLAWSPSMCASSPGLQVGYRTLHGLLPRRLKVWVARLCLGFWQPAACAAVPALGTAGAGGAAALAAAADSDVALCMHYQPTALLLFGFIASTWLAWCGEVRQRTGFLQRTLLRQQPGEEGRRAASAGDEQACLRREAAAELAAGVPSGWDFFMFYAAPILVCLFLVERCLWADAALPLYN